MRVQTTAHHLNTTGGTGFSREVPILNLTSHHINHDMLDHVFQFGAQKPGWPWIRGCSQMEVKAEASLAPSVLTH